jgi:hypothetical protein
LRNRQAGHSLQAAGRRRRAAELMHSAQQLPQESSKTTRFDHVMRMAAVYAVTLFLVAPPAAHGRELASTPPARSVARKAPRLVLQVNTNEPAMMNLALKQRDQRRASLDSVNSSHAAERNHLSPFAIGRADAHQDEVGVCAR